MDVVSDAISAVRVGRPSSARLRVSGDWAVRLAPYEGAGFHVVLSGTCALLPDGGGAPVPLGTGDVVFVPHGAGHVLADATAGPDAARRARPFEAVRERELPLAGAGPEVRLLCGKYRLDRSRTHPMLAELPDLVHLPYGDSDSPELRGAVDLLARESEADGDRPGASLVLPGLLDLLLVYMIRAWAARARTGNWPAALADPATATALHALHSDPAAPWTNDLLAARAGVSRATLSRRFTSLVGRPPMAYLTSWQLTLAATRLRDSDAPLATVARETGYGSPYALSHAFSREFGITPGRYRVLNS
ncbi:AraC family transcriptional regulator [Streptomyces broussonetiae]|uniref:Helix-turn-helix domain-containing protein n=1 Tax=Streptomyces broussonetiae TaxID=2686304 RepID=A0A6I6N4G6_9ACTN|nr:AraC family transcriptional regulator [Streptomyces broussonetiae]QHA06354.1 helix-turn-helix domain-containing protein [Streptomyces broussonetiae]